MDTLYHYCSTASFHAITQSHALWLSSLSLSNDTMEGKLVARAIARLAERDSLESKGFRLLQRIIVLLELAFDGLGFCLSEEGDLLSQWRGYAGDATGVAIGFSVEYLKWLSKKEMSHDNPAFILQAVEYEPSGHEARVERTYRKVTQLIKDGEFKPSRPLGLMNTGGMTDQEIEVAGTANRREELLKVIPKLILLLPQLFFLKSKAFEEEREWRLVSLLPTDGEDACLHRVVDNRIVPYLKVELVELERSPIVEVILGPKHGTPPKIVENFLKLNDYGLVKVTRSEASYR